MQTLWGSRREHRPGAHPLAFTPNIQRSGMADAPGRVGFWTKALQRCLCDWHSGYLLLNPHTLHLGIYTVFWSQLFPQAEWNPADGLDEQNSGPSAERLGTRDRGRWVPVDWSSGACPLYYPATTARAEALSSSPCFVLLLKKLCYLKKIITP